MKKIYISDTFSFTDVFDSQFLEQLTICADISDPAMKTNFVQLHMCEIMILPSRKHTGVNKLKSSQTSCTLYMSFVEGTLMSHVMRKSDFYIWENKSADQLHGNFAADQQLCFNYKDSTMPLFFQSEI